MMLQLKKNLTSINGGFGASPTPSNNIAMLPAVGSMSLKFDIALECNPYHLDPHIVPFWLGHSCR